MERRVCFGTGTRSIQAVFLIGLLFFGGVRVPDVQAGNPAGPLGFSSGSSREDVQSPAKSSLPEPSVLPPAVWFQEEGVPGRNPSFGLVAPDGNPGWTLTLANTLGGPGKSGEREDFYAGAIESGGRLWAGSVQGDVFSIDASRGQVLWKVSLSGPIFAPLVAGPKTLYAVTATPGVTVDHLVLYTKTRRLIRGDGRECLWAISRRDGRILWSIRFQGGVLSSPMLLSHTVSVVTGRGHLLFLSRQDGHTVVDLPIAKGSFGWASPVLGSGHVVLAQENPPVYHAVSLDGPRRVWRFQWEGTRSWDHFFIGTPLLVGNQIVGVLRKRTPPADLAVSLSLDAGTPLWKASFPSGKQIRTEDMSIPTSADGVVYASSPLVRILMALDLSTGKTLWSLPLREPVQSGGTVVGRLLVLPLPSGRVEFVDRASGRIVSEARVAGSLGPHPLLVVGHTLYVAGRDGTVRAIPFFTFGEHVSDLAGSPFSSGPQGQPNGSAEAGQRKNVQPRS